MSGYGTEVSFRLGPESLEEARVIAARLADAAEGCRRHVLFADAAAGEYGCLAEWDSRQDAEDFMRRPATAEEISVLGARLGREPRIRLYAMEEAG